MIIPTRSYMSEKKGKNENLLFYMSLFSSHHTTRHYATPPPLTQHHLHNTRVTSPKVTFISQSKSIFNFTCECIGARGGVWGVCWSAALMYEAVEWRTELMCNVCNLFHVSLSSYLYSHIYVTDISLFYLLLLLLFCFSLVVMSHFYLFFSPSVLFLISFVFCFYFPCLFFFFF